jgi:hypothetical protein
MVMALAVWAGTQNFGGIFTGSSTDVGTGPAWILLALAFWPAARTRIRACARAGLLCGNGDRHHRSFGIKDLDLPNGPW